MFSDKFFRFVYLWGAIICAYLFLGFTMPVHNALVQRTLVEFNTSDNLSRLPGIYNAIKAYPVYVWFIPGLVGIVVTTIMLKTDWIK